MSGRNTHTRSCLVEKKKENDISIEDFALIKVLGKGSFGKVVLVEIKQKLSLNNDNNLFDEVLDFKFKGNDWKW